MKNKGELLVARRDPVLWVALALAFGALVFAALAYFSVNDIRRMMWLDRMYPSPVCDRCGSLSCCPECCEPEWERNKK